MNVQLEDTLDWQVMPPTLAVHSEWPAGLSSLQTVNQEEASLDDAQSLDRQLRSSINGGMATDVAPPVASTRLGSDVGPGWATTNRAGLPLCLAVFVPYVDLFFERLYPVFPVIDRACIMEHLQSHDASRPSPPSFYSFLAALSAAVMAQLNAADVENLEPPLEVRLETDCTPQQARSASFFVSQCLQTRQDESFIDEANEWTVLTSFFLFAYFGNLDQSRPAWYYLREAISFAQALGIDEAGTYVGLDSRTAERRRRLFWLLFITERYELYMLSCRTGADRKRLWLADRLLLLLRAYSLQHRRRAVLRASIELPCVFDSECPKLLFGFVTLAKVFSKINEEFMAAWVHPMVLDCGNDLIIAEGESTPKPFDLSWTTGTISPPELNETQRLDIAVTQQWLRVLTCQLNIRRSPRRASDSSGGTTCDLHSQYVIESAKDMLHTIMSAGRGFLEAHGIGMVRIFLPTLLAPPIHKRKAPNNLPCCGLLRSADLFLSVS